MKAGFIYITTNLVNGTKYIGQHTRFDDKYLGSGTLLCKAIEKYGKENFKREIIDYADTKEELNELEKFYIKKYDAVKSPMFYNIAEGGNVINYWAGKERENFKQSISGSKNGKYEKGYLMVGKFSGEKNPMYGFKGKPHKSVVMMDLEFNILKKFESMAELWRYCLAEFNDDRGPSTKDRLYIRGRQIYKDQFYFCKETELEDFLFEKNKQD